MKNRRFNLSMVLTVLILAALFVTPVAAQQEGFDDPMQQPEAPQVDVDSAELDQFADAMNEVQEIQIDSQTRIESEIDASELDQQRFQEIHSAAINPQVEAPEDISDAEQAAYDDLLDDLVNVEQEAQEEMQMAVQDAGLDVERFNEIATAIQQDDELWQRLQERMQ